MEKIKPVEKYSEDLVDIEGSENQEHEWGEQFRGWYLTITAQQKTVLPLGYKDITYEFTQANYNYQFIMPSVIRFNGGLLTYGVGERKLGIFRFPIDKDGNFCTPVKLNPSKIMELSEDDIKDLIRDRKVITFDAYKIPQFWFEFFLLKDEDFQGIREKTNESFLEEFKDQYEKEKAIRIDAIKKKILSLPNNLLILQEILDLHRHDIKEVSAITNNIIHDGI